MKKDNISYSVECLISQNEIKSRITELGKKINKHYIKTEKLLVVGLIRG